MPSSNSALKQYTAHIGLGDSSTQSFSRVSIASSRRSQTEPTQRPYMVVLAMRHGEPVDASFPGWQRLALLGDHYCPFDLNMPLTIPKRPQAAFDDDSPLTETGRLTAQMVGRGLRLAQLAPEILFSAPELRCVQTAAALINTLQNHNAHICIEPGLAGWRQWCSTPPTWLSPEQLAELALPIDLSYEPQKTVQSLVATESPTDYYKRVFDALAYAAHAARNFPMMLVVAHGATMEVVETGRWTTAQELDEVERMFPYCAIRGVTVVDKTVTPLINPIKPITTFAFSSGDRQGISNL